jgi:hypothetical protein
MDRDKVTLSLTGQELLTLHTALKSCLALKGVKFGMAVVRIMEAMKSDITVLESAIKIKADFEKYQQAVEKAAAPYWELSNGQQLVEIREYDQRPKIKEEYLEVFQPIHAALAETHAQAIKDRVEQVAEYRKALEEQYSVLCELIDPVLLPKEITLNQVVGIFPAISYTVLETVATKPVTFTKRQLLNFYTEILPLIGYHASHPFTSAMLSNLRMLYHHYQGVVGCAQVKAMEKEYEAARLQLMKDYAMKDAYMTPKQVYDPASGQSGFAMANPDRFNKEMRLLEKTCKKVIEEFNTLMGQVDNIALYQVSEDVLPADMSGDACRMFQAIIV